MAFAGPSETLPALVYSAEESWIPHVSAYRNRFCTGLYQPPFSKNAVSPIEALSLLRQSPSFPDIAFWPDDMSLLKALSQVKTISGHPQITDAYLLGLAHAHERVLATLDEGLLHLARDKSRIEISNESGIV